MRHGYTQLGEFVGSGLNWGSNVYHLQIESIKEKLLSRATFDLIYNYQDFLNDYTKSSTVLNPSLYPWIDYVPGFQLIQQKNQLIYQLNAQWVISRNYFWNQTMDAAGITQLPINHNLFLRLNLTYQL